MLITLTLTVWFALALWVGATGLFLRTTPPQVAITVWGLVAATLIVTSVMPAAKALSLRALVSIHLMRFVGVAFIVLFLQGRLPFSFGLLGGAGDILVATGAVAILILRPARSATLAWNTLGLIDIVAVVASALKEGLKDPVMMAPLRAFPLSLLPTFFVPLIIVSHILIYRHSEAGN